MPEINTEEIARKSFPEFQIFVRQEFEMTRKILNVNRENNHSEILCSESNNSFSKVQ